MNLLLQLAQDADPTGIGEKLAQAQDVQQVLGYVVGFLVLALFTTVAYHVRREQHWEGKVDGLYGRLEKALRRLDRSVAALAGLEDSFEDAEEGAWQ